MIQVISKSYIESNRYPLGLFFFFLLFLLIYAEYSVIIAKYWIKLIFYTNNAFPFEIICGWVAMCIDILETNVTL